MSRPLLGAAAAWLDTLLAIEPLYWTPFYDRARLFRGRPRKASPEVIVDLTRACPLACDFCFAAETRDMRRHLEVATALELAAELRGLPRLTLVGGEPLAHPRLRDLMRVLGATGAAIEIYTSGLTVPDDPVRRSRWLADRFDTVPGPVALTLSVDRFHREQLGGAGFERKICSFVELATDASAPVEVRFNVTDESLSSAGYLVQDRVRDCLAALHPELGRLFVNELPLGRAGRRFRFNPVVRLGRAADAPGEYLQAEDLLLRPDIVLGPGADGGAEAFAGLPATWMASPPPGLRLGAVAPGKLADLVRDHFAAAAVGAPLVPELYDQLCRFHVARRAAADPAELSRAADYLRLHVARRIADGDTALERRWYDATAAGLEALCSHPGCGWSLCSDRPRRRLTIAVLRRFLERHVRRHPGAGRCLVADLADLIAGFVASEAWPAFTGYAPRSGLLTDPPDAPVPLRDAPLDQGVRTPYYGDALIRPRLVARLETDAACGLHLRLDGLGGVPRTGDTSPDEVLDGFRWLMATARFLLPAGLHRAWHELLRARLPAPISTLALPEIREQGFASGREAMFAVLGEAADSVRGAAGEGPRGRAGAGL